MKGKYWGIFVLLGIAALLLSRIGIDMDVKPVTVENMPEGVYTEVLPRVELLSGVLSQTSWINQEGPRGKGHRYYRELKEFFSKYKDHRAIQIAEELTQRGFTYDAPPNFIVSLGELPDLKLEGEYSDYLIGRAGSKEILEEFRLALIDLSQESNFESFFEEHRDELEEYLSSTVNGFDGAKAIEWMKDFYGWTGSEFHMVLAPAMFPGGGYGATAKKPNGNEVIFQIIREEGASDVKPQFPDGHNLELLTLHEWGHAYVNPSIEEHKDLIKQLQLSILYESVREEMYKQAYGNEITFFYEQVLRGVTTIAAKDLYGEEVFSKVLQRQKERNFYLTEFTVEQLEYYRKNRDQYKTFNEFIPYLFEQYNRNKEKLLQEIKK